MYLVNTRRLLRAICGLSLALAVLPNVARNPALGDDKPSALEAKLGPIAVNARTIAAFDRNAPDKTRFGKLTWRGGLVLTSSSTSFGGWSGLVLNTDGSRLLAVSDAGAWMSGRLTYDGGKPTGMTDVRLGPIQSASGEALVRNRDRDAESLALVGGTPVDGKALISFERQHRILRFDVRTGVLSAAKGSIGLPTAAKSLPANSGIEAIAVLRGSTYKGSLIAFAESKRDASGDHVAWLWIDGSPQQIFLTNPADFDVTDAAALPDGSLLVLERRFRWNEGVKARLRLIKRTELRPNAHIDAETLLTADVNREIDNMEGLAVHTGPGGEIVVTMISDDNFNKGLQRTVLLQFSLDAADLASSETRLPR